MQPGSVFFCHSLRHKLVLQLAIIVSVFERSSAEQCWPFKEDNGFKKLKRKNLNTDHDRVSLPKKV